MISKKLVAVCLLSTALLVGCGSKPAENKDNGQATKTEGFTGTKTYETLYDATGKKGDVIVLDVEFKDGKATKASVDVRQEDGSMKKQAAKDGKYVMKAGEAKNWAEQMELVEAYLNENAVDVSKVKITDNDGHTDAVSGVSIKVGTYLTALQELLDSVK